MLKLTHEDKIDVIRGMIGMYQEIISSYEQDHEFLYEGYYLEYDMALDELKYWQDRLIAIRSK